MIIRGRSISAGKAEGTVVKLNEAFSFLGGVNASTGELNVGTGNIAGKVFVFPKGKGSTVGSFVVYDLMVHGKAPAALINSSAETIVTTGAVISSVPMVDSVDVDVIFDGDTILVDGDAGTIEIKNVKGVRVVSSAIIVDGKVLLLRRPKTAGSFPDTQSLVAGKIEKGEDPEEAAKREIFEETQIKVSKPDVSLPPVYVREGDTLWEVFPFLYRLGRADPVLNHENVDFEWVSPEDLRTKIPKTVPLTYKVVTEMLKK
jgi:predicted aconitase with swiveling domain/predicted NUDIX family NTP pyrophosphohydrolase